MVQLVFDSYLSYFKKPHFAGLRFLYKTCINVKKLFVVSFSFMNVFTAISCKYKYMHIKGFIVLNEVIHAFKFEYLSASKYLGCCIDGKCKWSLIVK